MNKQAVHALQDKLQQFGVNTGESEKSQKENLSKRPFLSKGKCQEIITVH